MRPEVRVFALQLRMMNRSSTAILKHIRAAIAQGADENTLLPAYGMCLGELCTVAHLQELHKVDNP